MSSTLNTTLYFGQANLPWLMEERYCVLDSESSLLLFLPPECFTPFIKRPQTLDTWHTIKRQGINAAPSIPVQKHLDWVMVKRLLSFSSLLISLVSAGQVLEPCRSTNVNMTSGVWIVYLAEPLFIITRCSEYVQCGYDFLIFQLCQYHSMCVLERCYRLVQYELSTSCLAYMQVSFT